VREIIAHPAGEADVGPLAEVLGRAFADDPLNRHLVPDDRRRAGRLRGGFAEQLRHVFLPNGAVLTTPDRAGAALWLGPGAQRLPLSRQVRMLPGMVRLFGARGMPAAMRALAELDARAPREAHWHLSLLGVAPERQGAGIGSALLRPILERCDREVRAAYLETANRGNLRFYERHGFAVRERVDLRGGVRVWTMLRPPGRQARVGAGVAGSTGRPAASRTSASAAVKSSARSSRSCITSKSPTRPKFIVPL
jgi:ribosomal protein S18 acetylase RimI-like enzyme